MKNKIIIGVVLSIVSLDIFSSCTTIPQKAKAIENFNVNRYLGVWYEIARSDNKFERNLDNVTAKYSLKSNDELVVFNSGYNYEKKEWKSITGSAEFRGDKNTAALKVTFFKPFYGGYNVIAIDEDYKYALVAGNDLDYLWLLSKEKSLPENIKQQYLKLANEIGYDTSKLIWVNQDKINPFVNEK
jgi:apolipoprotein D and lipocalin family protein